ncbi:MAG TPA: cation transporter [Nitrospirota bacterium]
MTSDLPEKGITFEYAAIGWTAACAIASFVSGVNAGSIALIAFGLDSAIAGAAAGMLARRLRRTRAEPTVGRGRGAAAGKSGFAVGVSFFLLALYLLNESASRLYYEEKSETSLVGIVIAALTMVVMIVLTVMELRLTPSPGIRIFREYARENAVRGFLSLVLFAGLGLHILYGWWWADPAAVFLMIPVIIHEGWTAIESSKESGRDKTTEKRTPD